MYTPEELMKSADDDAKSKNFEYYRKHILLENYDEEPEEKNEILDKIDKN